MFRKIKWLLHPITMLILAQICWGLLMFVWIRWYILRSQEISILMKKFPLPASPSGQWVILLQGCILMAFILIGLYMIFVNQRRLSRLAKMQDAILSSVTHELKTPLASMRLYTETLLLRKVSAEEQHKFLMRTLAEADRLQRLIDTVLISARLQADKSTESLGRVELTEIINACYQKAVERFSDVRKFDYTVHHQEGAKNDPVFVFGNSNHLTILFDNLIDNAVKYTKKGGIIKVNLLIKKDSLSVCVKDDGAGIEKQNIKKIFGKFYRIHSAAQSNIKGSGLGLSVCYSIVHEHHGKIYAQSEGLNKGSSFYVELKRLLAHN